MCMWRAVRAGGVVERALSGTVTAGRVPDITKQVDMKDTTEVLHDMDVIADTEPRATSWWASVPSYKHQRQLKFLSALKNTNSARE